MDSDDRHIPDEKVQEVLNCLIQADVALTKAAKSCRAFVDDLDLCLNCRLDAINEETVISCAGLLLLTLQRKLVNKLSDAGIQPLQ